MIYNSTKKSLKNLFVQRKYLFLLHQQQSILKSEPNEYNYATKIT